MATDTNDLEDSEALYCDDELDGIIVSQTQYEDGRTELLDVLFCVYNLSSLLSFSVVFILVVVKFSVLNFSNSMVFCRLVEICSLM